MRPTNLAYYYYYYYYIYIKNDNNVYLQRRPKGEIDEGLELAQHDLLLCGVRHEVLVLEDTFLQK